MQMGVKKETSALRKAAIQCFSCDEIVGSKEWGEARDAYYGRSILIDTRCVYDKMTDEEKQQLKESMPYLKKVDLKIEKQEALGKKISKYVVNRGWKQVEGGEYDKEEQEDGEEEREEARARRGQRQTHRQKGPQMV